MAYELVPVNPRKPAPDTTDDGEWDVPPLPIPPVTQRKRAQRRASAAQHDADGARAAGDDAFAAQRETDAAEHRQHGWGTGDARTWAWIAAMFFGFLILVAFVYFMPHGRHNQNDGGNSGGSPTPASRYY